MEQVFVNHDIDRLDVTLRSSERGPAPGAAAHVGSGQAARAAGAVATGRTDVRTKPGLLAKVVLVAAVVAAALGLPLPTVAVPMSAPHAAVTARAAPGFRDEVVHTTAKHPWLTADRGWVTAGQLRPGEAVVRADGTTAVVVSLRAIPGAGRMYDLTVSDLHTFAVGAGRYVVRNCGTQVDYTSNDPLVQRVRNARLSGELNGGKGDKLGNYGAALLDDGTTIVGKSVGKGAGGIHAEEDLLNQAGKRGILALYTEYEPCAAKCAALVQRIPKVAWSWAFNGDTDEATIAIRAQSRILRRNAISALFSRRQ